MQIDPNRTYHLDTTEDLILVLSLAVTIGTKEAQGKEKSLSTKELFGKLKEQMPLLRWRYGHERAVYAAYKTARWNIENAFEFRN